MAISAMIDLECGMCATHYSAEQLINLCPACGKPLLVRYDLARAAQTLTRESLRDRQPNMWRYQEVLPVRDPSAIINLGEGWTPLIHAKRLGQRIGCGATYVKDESLNPTGSFKARGQAAAISRALELGATAIAIPSAGNAAGAMSAYAAAAGLAAHVFMPADVPLAFRAECAALGAHVTLVNGLINDCGARVREGAALHGWFDVSTLREPYRIEGKKTMGYELAEQLDWHLPDVLIYPTGGGTGLVGMWKAFDELQEMGLIGPKRPRLVCVQAAGCAPIVQAFATGQEHAPLWQAAKTIADGLRVPIAIGDFLIIRALRASTGTALTVSDQEMLDYTNLLGATTGIFAAPEGGACLAAQVKLLESGWIAPDEQVVLMNTGTGLKYAHLWEQPVQP
jgi:threonine synthase